MAKAKKSQVRDDYEKMGAEMIKKFTIPGLPLGYYAQGARSKWKMSPDQRARAEKYRAWQEAVRLYAVQAGIRVPLSSSKLSPMLINTKAYFASGVHCDPGNVQKGVCDALFKGTSDKHVGGSFPPPLYDTVKPRIEVEVEWLEASLIHMEVG